MELKHADVKNSFFKNTQTSRFDPSLRWKQVWSRLETRKKPPVRNEQNLLHKHPFGKYDSR